MQLARSEVLEVRPITHNGPVTSTAGLAVLLAETPWLALWLDAAALDHAVSRLALDDYHVGPATTWQRDFGGILVEGRPYWQR